MIVWEARRVGCDWQWGKVVPGLIVSKDKYCKRCLKCLKPRHGCLASIVPDAVTCHETRKKARRSEAQSINLTSIAESKSVYDTSKPRLIYPEEAQQFFPSQRVNWPSKRNLLAISCHWESKARVKRGISHLYECRGWEENAWRKEVRNAQE